MVMSEHTRMEEPSERIDASSYQYIYIQIKGDDCCYLKEGKLEKKPNPGQ